MCSTLDALVETRQGFFLFALIKIAKDENWGFGGSLLLLMHTVSNVTCCSCSISAWRHVHRTHKHVPVFTG